MQDQKRPALRLLQQRPATADPSDGADAFDLCLRTASTAGSRDDKTSERQRRENVTTCFEEGGAGGHGSADLLVALIAEINGECWICLAAAKSTWREVGFSFFSTGIDF